MMKLSSWKEVCPFPRVVGTEDMEICMFQPPDWFTQFVCLFGGDMQWIV